MDEVKNNQCCIENRQLASTSSSSGSERTYSAPLKSPGICSPVKTSPSRRRTTGPIRRAKGGWTPEEDEKLKNAVKAFKGKSWKKIAESFPDRSEVQCLHRWRKVLNPDLVKGPWSQEEDSAIIELVSKYGPAKWSLIAKSLPGRIGKQCRERWHNHLNPMIKKDAWTPEEELAVMDAHQKHGNKWAEIAKVLPGRTDNSIKNHWYTYLRKKLNYYMATGKLPPPDMESGAKDLKPFRSIAPDRITVHDSERIEVTARSSSGNTDFHQMDEACKNQLKSSNLQFLGSESSARTVVNGSNNSDNREHNQVAEKLGIICSKSSSISTSVNSGNDGVVENGNNVPGTPVGVAALGSLLVEKQQQESFNVPSDSVTINTRSCADDRYDSTSVMSPACFFSPPTRQSSGMGSLSAESILKSAARSFPNIPSILRKRRREARSPQILERTEEADNVKAKESSHTPEEKVTVGDKQEQPGFQEANYHCESPCDSNSTVGVWLYNGQAFDASPPYRLSSKRADIIKSVEKQLDFEFDGDNFDSQPRSTNLVIRGTVTEDSPPPLKFFYRRKNRKISKAGGGLT